jgi:hypothetical protein
LNHSNISDENSVKVTELPIEFSNKYHKWYLDSYASAYFINNKRYFKSYRQINNYTVLTITSDSFSIEGIEIIQLEVLISKEIKIRFQINDIYYSL